MKQVILIIFVAFVLTSCWSQMDVEVMDNVSMTIDAQPRVYKDCAVGDSIVIYQVPSISFSWELEDQDIDFPQGMKMFSKTIISSTDTVYVQYAKGIIREKRNIFFFSAL